MLREGRPKHRVGLWLGLGLWPVALLALVACAPALPSGGPSEALGPGEAVGVAPGLPLRISLSEATALLGGKRSLAQLQPSAKAVVQVDGLDLAAPLNFQVEADASGVATVPNVPVGGVRVVRVALGATPETAATASALGTLVRMDKGATAPVQAKLSATWSVVAKVAEEVLAFDRAEKTKVLDRVVPDDLASTVAALARTGGLASPSHLDTRRLALKVRARSGQAPVLPLEAADVLRTGQLVLDPQGWPPGLWAEVRISDPISRPAPWNGEGPLLIDPVAAGEWTLELVPERPGLPTVRTVVGVPVNALGRSGVGFGQAEVGTALPYPVSPGFGGLLGVGTNTRLVLGGGLTTADGDGLGLLEGLIQRDKAGTWSDLGTWPVALRGAPSASSPLGELASLGGTLPDGQLASGAFVRDAVASSTPRSLASLPEELRRQDGVGVYLGGRWWVVGGTNAEGTAMPPMAMLEPGTAAFVRSPVELPTGRTLVAGALVGSRWIVVGGLRLASLAEQTAGASFEPTVQGVAEAFEVGTPLRWTQLAPMPTPRAGATAVAVNDELWVLGGADRFGRPLSTVEVFKVSLGTWVTKPPLSVARVRPVAAFLDGRIVVSGGAKGLGQNAAPIASVELVKP